MFDRISDLDADLKLLEERKKEIEHTKIILFITAIGLLIAGASIGFTGCAISIPKIILFGMGLLGLSMILLTVCFPLNSDIKYYNTMIYLKKHLEVKKRKEKPK